MRWLGDFLDCVEEGALYGENVYTLLRKEDQPAKIAGNLTPPMRGLTPLRMANRQKGLRLNSRKLQKQYLSADAGTNQEAQGACGASV